MMGLTTVIVVFILVIFALVATFLLGANQHEHQNKTYDQSRRKTIIWLSIIYLVAIVLGIWFIYDAIHK